MGTKNNPGAFDCYVNAEPDEPMFVLLARDKHAPTLVYLWSVLRELDGEDAVKVAEALECVRSMIKWSADHNRKSVGLGQATLAGVMELIRAANMGVTNSSNSATDENLLRRILSRTEFEE
jgi:hypothetical protein